MKARTKSALLLLATLGVGVLIGALAASAVLNLRLDQLRALRERGGFTQRVEEVIQPQDEAQREAIHAVLERSHNRFRRAQQRFFAEFSANRDSLRAELAPLLTPDQQARLDEWFARDRRGRRERGRSDRDRRPPPGERAPD